jgi:hypothetical protein
VNIVFTYAITCNSLFCSGVYNRPAATLGPVHIQLTIVGRKNACILDFITHDNGCCLFLFGGIVINGSIFYAANAFLCGCEPHIGLSCDRVASEVMKNAGECIWCGSEKLTDTMQCHWSPNLDDGLWARDNR